MVVGQDKTVTMPGRDSVLSAHWWEGESQWFSNFTGVHFDSWVAIASS